MSITVKCYATLSAYQPENPESFPLTAGETVASLIDRLGIDPDEVKITFVNSRSVAVETPLHDGDRVGIFPAVGGG
ncbi:MoaD/ThiS family protein [Desulfohalobium retbaense]|uniref:ThiamineS protein n=1 Tax=Desulfohalobium retbaense (strain ATCC 49708 / DSM 5692 / JCM 16813 / HR100) TaxID=485915 RepID=C8WZK0_DESRD|nr:MoaD/ThiS family protein [Desulfohalobium retbaense]ACV67475.1 thiamineS protein [Desulfohalobium retbaense DSM 5692]